MRAVRTLGAVLLATAVAGCGGVDRDDPEAVLRAYWDTAGKCGEEGAGRRFELTVDDPDFETRQEAIEKQRRSGCRPDDPAPVYDVFELSHGPDWAQYAVETEVRGRRVKLPVVLLRTEDGWKLDRDRRHW